MTDPGGLVDVLVGLERLAAQVTAAQAHVLAVLGPSLVFGDDDWLREEVAAALHLSGVAAQRRVDVARDLCTRLPATLAALSAGEISYLHAVAIAEATRDLDQPALAAVEDRVTGRAASQTVAELRRSVTRAVLAADPARAATAHQRAVAQRTVQAWPMPDGMAELRALLDAPDAALVMATISTRAGKAGPDDPRGVDARRADALVSLVTGATLPSDPARSTAPARMQVQVQVTVPADTLLGLADAPGELAGYGPITADVARCLATHGPWRRLVTHPTTGHLLHRDQHTYPAGALPCPRTQPATGHPLDPKQHDDRTPGHPNTWRRLLTDPVTIRFLDYGRTRYRPPAALAAFVIARDRVCQFPGCNRHATRCDLDHRTPWNRGGTTCPHNLGPLCRRHHRAKHGPWTLHRNPDGSITWTSPTGMLYHQPPPSYDDP